MTLSAVLGDGFYFRIFSPVVLNGLVILRWVVTFQTHCTGLALRTERLQMSNGIDNMFSTGWLVGWIRTGEYTRYGNPVAYKEE